MGIWSIPTRPNRLGLRKRKFNWIDGVLIYHHQVKPIFFISFTKIKYGRRKGAAKHDLRKLRTKYKNLTYGRK